MRRTFAYLLAATYLTAGLAGCASHSYEETRELRSEPAVFYKPKNIKGYDGLNAAWMPWPQDRSGATFGISLVSTQDEYQQSKTAKETRRNQNPAILSEWPIFLAVYPLLNCLGSLNCFTTKYGQWQKVGENNVGVPVFTGKSEVRRIPLQNNYPGRLTLTGIDEKGAKVGEYQTPFVFGATNTVWFSDLTQFFESRPSQIRLVGTFQMPNNMETIELTANAGQLSQINFGVYLLEEAWIK